MYMQIKNAERRGILPSCVGRLAGSPEARKLYCLCFTDVESKAQRCQEVSGPVSDSTPRKIHSHPPLQSRVPESSSRTVTPPAFSTILFRTTSVLIVAVPSEHLRYTSTGKHFFFGPAFCRK